MDILNNKNFDTRINRFFSCIKKYNYKIIHGNGRDKKIKFLTLPCSFDIETYSINKELATMYIWQFAINETVIIGRTWEEFLEFLHELKNHFSLSNNQRLIVYVHNLEFEFQFIKDWLNWIDIFATDNRKPLYALCDLGILFKCSYRLSGYSLKRLGELIKNPLPKLTGDLDYTLARNSKTKLTGKEILYCVHDVIIVTRYINDMIKRFSTITQIPLTQTGIVRRDVRTHCFKDKKYRFFIQSLKMSEFEYHSLRRAFQGGFTHSNFIHTNKVIDNVTSYDFTSSYPTVMLSELYPCNNATFLKNITHEQFNLYRKKYCMIFDIKFFNIKTNCYENYLSYSKCITTKNRIINNGRVFYASELFTTITNIDFDIIEKCYSYDDFEISNVFLYKKDYLPKPIIEKILEYYELKTTLKGVKGKEDIYLHSKEMLNSIYGMCVTSLHGVDYNYNNHEWIETEKENFIDKENNNKNRFLFYAYGVFVTAYARRNLWQGILECKTDYIYSDTDSIKIINAKSHKNFIYKYNRDIMEKLENCCKHYNIDINKLCPITNKNSVKKLGVWDFDGRYKKFKTLGAKRYIYFDDDLHITIAGVNKTTGKEYFKLFDNPFKIFTSELSIPKEYSGKLIHCYNDNEFNLELVDYQGNKDIVHEKSCIALYNSDYNLSVPLEYANLINDLKYRKYIENPKEVKNELLQLEKNFK